MTGVLTESYNGPPGTRSILSLSRIWDANERPLFLGCISLMEACMGRVVRLVVAVVPVLLGVVGVGVLGVMC